MSTAESRMLAGEVFRLTSLAARLAGRTALRRRRRRRANGPIRALFLSCYPPSHHGTSTRMTRWAAVLRNRGIEVSVRCPTTDEEFASFGRGDIDADRRYLAALRRSRERQILEARDADFVWLHRGLLPFGPWQRPTFERILAYENPRVVFDVYDSLWAHRQRAFEAARSRIAAWLNPPDTIQRIAGLCRAVTAANTHLAARLKAANPDVTILPMVVDPSAYPMKLHGPKEPVVLGWMGNSGNLSALASIGPAIAHAAEQVPIRLRVVSSVHFDLPGVKVESLTHPYSPESEIADLMAVDAGLLPLTDNEVSRGKSPLKLLQFGAAGLPVVASPVAIDPAHFSDDEAILFAKDERSWIRALVRVAKFPALRRRLGRAVRQTIETHYSYAAHAATFSSLVERVARSGRRESSLG